MLCYITGGGGGGGSWGGDRELQETPDTVFITGLSQDIVEEDLIAHFGSIGVIKVCILAHPSQYSTYIYTRL